jgi:hypothetical protein
MKARLLAIHPVLMAHDVTASVQFYLSLGFSLTFQDQADHPTYAGVVRDSLELHIQWADPSQWAFPTDRPAYRFLVSDVDAMFQAFRERGSINATTSEDSPWASPAETPWGTREFHLRDPGRNSLQFYRPSQGAA